MGLSQALGAAVSGLRVTQSSLSLVAGNIANAGTTGYVRKTASQLTTVVGDYGIGVRSTGVNRELDLYTQRALRTETAGGNYAEIFERNVGQASPLKLERGLNATWSKGGLMYAIPFK